MREGEDHRAVIALADDESFPARLGMAARVLAGQALATWLVHHIDDPVCSRFESALLYAANPHLRQRAASAARCLADAKERPFVRGPDGRADRPTQAPERGGYSTPPLGLTPASRRLSRPSSRRAAQAAIHSAGRT
jgi:hypothetical protein